MGCPALLYGRAMLTFLMLTGAMSNAGEPPMLEMKPGLQFMGTFVAMDAFQSYEADLGELCGWIASSGGECELTGVPKRDGISILAVEPMSRSGATGAVAVASAALGYRVARTDVGVSVVADNPPDVPRMVQMGAFDATGMAQFKEAFDPELLGGSDESMASLLEGPIRMMDQMVLDEPSEMMFNTIVHNRPMPRSYWVEETGVNAWTVDRRALDGVATHAVRLRYSTKKDGGVTFGRLADRRFLPVLGLHSDDIVISYNDIPTTEPDGLIGFWRSFLQASSVTAVIERDGERRKFTWTLTGDPESLPDDWTLESTPSSRRFYAGIHKNAKGVLVMSQRARTELVSSPYRCGTWSHHFDDQGEIDGMLLHDAGYRGPLDTAQVGEGEVLLSFNGEPVQSIEGVYAWFAAVASGEPVTAQLMSNAGALHSVSWVGDPVPGAAFPVEMGFELERLKYRQSLHEARLELGIVIDGDTVTVPRSSLIKERLPSRIMLRPRPGDVAPDGYELGWTEQWEKPTVFVAMGFEEGADLASVDGKPVITAAGAITALEGLFRNSEMVWEFKANATRSSRTRSTSDSTSRTRPAPAEPRRLHIVVHGDPVEVPEWWAVDRFFHPTWSAIERRRQSGIIEEDGVLLIPESLLAAVVEDFERAKGTSRSEVVMVSRKSDVLSLLGIGDRSALLMANGLPVGDGAPRLIAALRAGEVVELAYRRTSKEGTVRFRVVLP